MPKGSPTPQTVASEKYQKKAGYMVKGFKLKRELVEAFEDACVAAGATPTSKVREFMEQFVRESNEKASE